MVAAVAAVRPVLAADSDPVVGTWQLNASKSIFKQGPALRSQTRIYSLSGSKITLEMKSVTAAGQEATSHTTYELNGKDFPVSGAPQYDSLSGRKVNNNTAKFTLKKGGKVVGHTSRTVSKDGKTLTSQSKVSSDAEIVENVLVFDRQ
jgi:hypothetical protein